MQLETLQKLCNNKCIKWSTHCLSRLQERDISIEDVCNCINNGEIIENYPDDFPHPSCLILGFTDNKQALHVVVGTNYDFLFIITAYHPNTNKFYDDFKTRRER